ncbi:hypothetical protein FB451DRAFT_1173111 [Mycena latifolia]|nr:hypothetical protein FB451DRAFT_1173111 [Mycena latifolia]
MHSYHEGCEVGQRKVGCTGCQYVTTYDGVTRVAVGTRAPSAGPEARSRYTDHPAELHRGDAVSAARFNQVVLDEARTADFLLPALTGFNITRRSPRRGPGNRPMLARWIDWICQSDARTQPSKLRVPHSACFALARAYPGQEHRIQLALNLKIIPGRRWGSSNRTSVVGLKTCAGSTESPPSMQGGGPSRTGTVGMRAHYLAHALVFDAHRMLPRLQSPKNIFPAEMLSWTGNEIGNGEPRHA